MEKLNRITVTMNNDNVKYIRTLQSQLLLKSDNSVSFSKTLDSLIKFAISRRPSITEIKEISEKLKN